MPASSNRAWNLESFIDSLIVELDKAQDTLSFKGITRKLSYTVKDVGLDLQIFPQFDGRQVRFVTAQPGESGSSKMSIQLGSITDRQIKETTKEPPSRDDISIDEVEGLDEGVKDSLRRVGITSAEDLERVERRNVNLERAVNERVAPQAEGDYEKRGPGVNYGSLAKLINQAKRKRQFLPRVMGVELAQNSGGRVLVVNGENLVMGGGQAPMFTNRGNSEAPEEAQFPVAMLDDERVPVLRSGEKSLYLAVPDHKLQSQPSILRVALDPYAVITMQIKP